MVFIVLEKAHERVPLREVWRWTREKGESEEYVRIVGPTRYVRRSENTGKSSV